MEVDVEMDKFNKEKSEEENKEIKNTAKIEEYDIKPILMVSSKEEIEKYVKELNNRPGFFSKIFSLSEDDGFKKKKKFNSYSRNELIF